MIEAQKWRESSAAELFPSTAVNDGDMPLANNDITASRG
jgi:hypothetical protein